MISEIEIQSFRSLREAKLSGLARVNIIVGRSAAGKTTLLEGIRIFSSPNPATLTTAIVNRNVQYRGSFSSELEYYDFFSGIFSDYKRDSEIVIEARARTSAVESVRVKFDFEKVVNVSPRNFDGSTTPTLPFSISPLEIVHLIDGVPEIARKLSLQENGLLDWGSREPASLNSFFGSSWDASSAQVAQWYSELSVYNQELDIAEAIQSVFPEIINLSIQNTGYASAIHAAVKGVARKIPLSSVSSGINKFISILITIKKHAGYLVLIDEIENGIFYQLMPEMWSVISRFARENQVQIFASTHSLECLRAASLSIIERPDDFSLVQTQYTNNGSKYFVTKGSDAAAAISGGLEVRR